MLKKYFAYKAFVSVSFITALLCTPAALAAGFDDQATFDEQSLYLNGQGPRKKSFITVYDTALYLTEKGSDATAIVSADHPMAVRLKVKSKLATAKRISVAFAEGIDQSTGGDTGSIQTQINSFLAVFDLGVVKNDAFDFVYMPDAGTAIYKNGTKLTTIVGLEFKQALFGIWLSDNPIAEKLKTQLLGQ